MKHRWALHFSENNKKMDRIINYLFTTKSTVISLSGSLQTALRPPSDAISRKDGCYMIRILSFRETPLQHFNKTEKGLRKARSHWIGKLPPHPTIKNKKKN